VRSKLRHAFHPREFLFPSNLLTIARLLLLPPTLAALRRGQRERALLLLGAAMLTDAVDGPIARARGEESALGQILDPIADKLLIDLAAITLTRTRGFPPWVTGLLLFRDAGIIICGLLAYRYRATITLSQGAGKLATVGLTAAALLYIADGPRSGRPALYAALVPFTISFFQYGRSFLRTMRGR
jgi:CDP-diacylglycerol--glycerol-3-phosphate 3-phosphatidyltransferase